jgi:hypothetical protein
MVRNVILLSISLLLFAAPAMAAKDIRFVDSTLIQKPKDTLEKALLSYGDWCDSGCQYKSPGVKIEERLAFESTKSRFYTWTWVSDIKDLKYFSEVTISRKKGSFTITKRALGDSDSALVKKLEKSSGHPHKPLLDSSVNIVRVKTVLSAKGPECKVTMDTKVRVGGFLSMFSGRVMSGLKESTKALFQSLKK